MPPMALRRLSLPLSIIIVALVTKSMFWVALVVGIYYVVMTGMHLRDWRRNRRLRQIGDGRCPECGYDLRGSSTPGERFFPVCPECGYDLKTGTRQETISN